MAAVSPAAVRPPTVVPAFRLARFGDERLARLVAAGNERAFAALYERYHQPLYRYCRSIVRDDTDAQDALQSTFANALVALRRAQRRAPMRPWLFRIAHNESISLLRRRGDGEELSEASVRPVASAEDQAGERQRFALLLEDLRELPERLRGALLMRELSGLSHQEIAIALDTSVGAAKQAIFDAREGLLAFAEGRAMACEEIRRCLSDGDGRVLRGRGVRAHLRSCQTCAAFSAAIPARRGELQALAPLLPPVASAATLSSILGAGSGHGAGGSAAALAAGAAGKTVGATLAAKALVGAAILATAAVGVTGVTGILRPTHHQPAAAHTRTLRSGPAALAAPLASGASVPAAVPGHAVHRVAVGAAAGRPPASTPARAGSPASGASGAQNQHHGVGASAALPSQSHGTQARNRAHAHAHGHRHTPSRGVGGHGVGSPQRRRSGAAGPPAQRPGTRRSATSGNSRPSGTGSSHRSAGSPSAHPRSRTR